MISKFLERKIEIHPDEGDEILSSPIKLEYYLVESPAIIEDAGTDETMYGIEIVKQTNGDRKESSCIRNISSNRENTREILDKLVRNTVTPVSLPFILDDIIGV